MFYGGLSIGDLVCCGLNWVKILSCFFLGLFSLIVGIGGCGSFNPVKVQVLPLLIAPLPLVALLTGFRVQGLNKYKSIFKIVIYTFVFLRTGSYYCIVVIE